MSVILERFGEAVDALRALGETELAPGEVRHQYTRELALSPQQLSSEEKLGKPVRALVDAGFKVSLTIEAYDTRWIFGVSAQAALEKTQTIDGDLPDLTDEAFAAFEALKRDLAAGLLPVPMPHAERAAGQGLPVRIVLSILLRKEPVQREIQGSASGSHVILFLFPERLAQIFEKTSLEDLEEGYFEAGRRTVFVVPGMRGLLAGDLMAVCGRDRAADLEAMLSRPLPSGEQKRIQEILAFCEWQCVWPARPAWLIPETFSVTLARDGDPAAENLRDRLASLRSLLSLLFLARRSGNSEVNFGSSPGDALRIVRADVPGSEELFQLYRFAYEGTSADKLELVRQLLAPIQETASLFGKARTVLQAADKAHGRYLKKNVDEYFAARRKTLDYVQEAVQEAESSTVKMTQEVAENVYKTFGAVALVVFARALDPKLTPLAALLAALALAVYLGIVLFYYLPTARSAKEVQKHLFEDHIRSFEDVLGQAETKALLENARLQRARHDFQNRRNWANGIYAFLFLASLLAAACYGL